MRHKDTIGLYEYWNEIRAGREAPLRSEISPAALGKLLPSVMLLERGEGGDLVFRLAGTKLCSMRCRELRGQSFSQLFRPEDRMALVKIVHSVEHGSNIVVLDTVARKRDGTGIAAEVSLLPLADETTRILGIVATRSTPYWFGAEAVELELRGIRYMDPHADLLFLQSRPSVPMQQRHPGEDNAARQAERIAADSGISVPKPAFREFRVLDGGKK